ncbi:MAG: hypothetical protein E7173_01645 [Firmicutes bacterium]|nr:hypothetical protein [Bacillota bacterium]
MKLKFRADAKDILMFIVFSIFLLYFVAIAVINLGSFAQEGVLVGLNPLPAFSSKYLFATIIGYIGALVAIIMSVSSLFFDREKGFGISTDPKKDKGYSRWATEKEMKKELKLVHAKDLKSDVAGIPLINNGSEIWVDDGEYHNLIIGSTGSGKTEMIVQPMVKVLAKKGESMIITDPKGEIYEKNAVELKEKGYNIVLLNFRDPQQGNCWNPLSLPYNLYKNGNQDKACELLDDLALNILYDEASKNQDPFWEKTSADYFAGLALGLFEDAKEEEINLNSINLMTTVGEEKIAGTTYIKEYFSYKDPAGPAYVNASSTLMAPSDTKGSILSVFKQKIKLFASRENMSEMLSHSDFDMDNIGRQKTAVFIVVQDEKKTYHSLVTIFLKQCYETLIRVAQESGGKLPYRTNFILDEFANMPPLKDVTTMVTAARSRAMRFSFIIQNFAQLYEVYGKENGETIKGNCGNIVYLISSELNALEEISKMCGEVKSKEKDKTASTPLVTVSDLQRLPKWTMILIRIRMMPFKTKLTPNWQMMKNNCWEKDYPKADYPNRDKMPVNVFNLKSFVEAKKEEKINAMLGGSPTQDSSMPIIPPMFGNKEQNPSTSGFNVDDLVKRIDAKIAELEEEERLEREQEEKKTVSQSTPEVVVQPTVNEKIENKNIESEVSQTNFIPNIPQQPIIEKALVNKESIDVPSEELPANDVKEVQTTDNTSTESTKFITDDQFFDDFFSEDE